MVETEFYVSEDDDAKTPTARSPTAPKGGRRQELVSQGVDSAVLATLDVELTFDDEKYTVLETMDPGFRDKSGQPVKRTVRALERAFDQYKLDLDKKSKLFEILGWEFECLDCHEVKAAAQFQGTSYILWGKCHPPHVHLRSGPCVTCREIVRMRSDRQSAIIRTGSSVPRESPACKDPIWEGGGRATSELVPALAGS